MAELYLDYPIESYESYSEPVWEDVQKSQKSRDLLLTALLWGPAAPTASLLFFFGQTVMAILTIAIAGAIHSVLRPRVAIYFLLMLVVSEWIIVILPGISTVTKFVGLWALIVSLPRLISTMFRSRWDPIVKWALSLIGCAGMSIIWASNRLVAVVGYQSLILVWGMPLLMCLHLNERRFLRTALFLFMCSCVLSAALYVGRSDVRAISGSYERSEAGALFGDDTGKAEQNVIARCFAVGIFAAIYFIVTNKKTSKKILFGCVVIILVPAIILTKTRAVYLFMPAALIAGIMLLKGGGLSKRVLLIILAVSLLGISVFVANKLGLLGAGVQERAASIFEEKLEAGNRLDYWKEHIEVFFQTGFRGIGLRQGPLLLRSQHTAHNDLITILGELGIFGAAVFVGFHLCLFRRIFRGHDQWLKLFCLMNWCFIIFAGLVQTDYSRKYYGMVVGLILVAVRIVEAERPHSQDYQFMEYELL